MPGPLAEWIRKESKWEGRRRWVWKGDGNLAWFAIGFCEKNTIRTVQDLKTADSGLYGVLKRRGMLPAAEQKGGRWASKSDDELIGLAIKIIEAEKLEGRSDLAKIEIGLYRVLHARGLFGQLGFTAGQRDWRSWSDAEILCLAERFIRENRIGTRGGLAKADNALYQVLWKRKLLDHLLSDADSQKQRDAVLGVIEAVGKFGDSE